MKVGPRPNVGIKVFKQTRLKYNFFQSSMLYFMYEMHVYLRICKHLCRFVSYRILCRAGF